MSCKKTHPTDPTNWCPPGACRGCDVARVLNAYKHCFNDLVAQGIPPDRVVPVVALATMRTVNSVDPQHAMGIIDQVLGWNAESDATRH